MRNIIKISQIESNRFELKQENCDLNILIEDAIKTLQPLADEKSIALNTELEPLFTLKLDTGPLTANPSQHHRKRH